MDPRIEDLLKVVKEVIEPAADGGYAIGGAVAMAVRGYARYTSDVDVFLLERSRGPVFRALRAAGLKVTEVAGPSHYIVMLPQHGGDPEVRIDLLVAIDDPEESAIELADKLVVTDGGVSFNIVERDLLAVMKFYAGRAGDIADLSALHARGAFDVQKARNIVSHIANTETVKEWDDMIASFAHRNVRPRPVRRLDRR